MPDFDVMIVGGGPAGATSAITCSRLGLKVLLVERDGFDRHKPCGGVLPPVCAEVISETLGKDIPKRLKCTPKNLGLYYVPPSGRENGGVVKNYKLLNVNRDLLDQWLRKLAEDEGVHVWYKTSLIDFRRSKPIETVLTNREGGVIKVTTRYLIGADGVYSRVRKQLYETKERFLHILQEHWKAEGEFEDCFYAFLSDEISSAPAYLIPKDGLFVIGVGVPKTCSNPISVYINRFKERLSEEFAFKQRSLERREVWAIPYGFVCEGIGNVILVGDAAGLCNPLSGEGIRLAIESGEAAGVSIHEAITDRKELAAVYSNNIESLASFVRETYTFATNLKDDDKELFIKSELSRVSLS